MESAIIAGGNGLIGRALVEELIKKNIPVLVLGSAKEMHDDLKKIKNSNISYYQIQNKQFWLEELIKCIKKKL
jgi:NAD dependent epimerase/dehydratase family enzyme